jgi:hypothetical protein
MLSGCSSGDGPEKAAEHSRLPSPFCYFLGQCQKVNKEKPIPKKKSPKFDSLNCYATQI